MLSAEPACLRVCPHADAHRRGFPSSGEEPDLTWGGNQVASTCLVTVISLPSIPRGQGRNPQVEDGLVARAKEERGSVCGFGVQLEWNVSLGWTSLGWGQQWCAVRVLMVSSYLSPICPLFVPDFSRSSPQGQEPICTLFVSYLPFICLSNVGMHENPYLSSICVS